MLLFLSAAVMAVMDAAGLAARVRIAERNIKQLMETLAKVIEYNRKVPEVFTWNVGATPFEPVTATNDFLFEDLKSSPEDPNQVFNNKNEPQTYPEDLPEGELLDQPNDDEDEVLEQEHERAEHAVHDELHTDGGDYVYEEVSREAQAAINRTWCAEELMAAYMAQELRMEVKAKEFRRLHEGVRHRHLEDTQATTRTSTCATATRRARATTRKRGPLVVVGVLYASTSESTSSAVAMPPLLA